MAIPVIMPKQGQSVESCIISEIRKKKGDKVTKGEILFIYETDKATFEEEAPANGILLDFFFSEGDEVPVFTNVCVIGSEGESAEEFRPGSDSVKQDSVNETAKPESVMTEAETGISSGSPFSSDIPAGINSPASPRARMIADKSGDSLSGLKGTGPGGRIIERDVRSAGGRVKHTPLARKLIRENPSLHANSGTGLAGSVRGLDLILDQQPGAEEFRIKPLTNMRKLIAKAMYGSLQNSAQLTHHLGADARRITELRRKVKKAMESGSSSDITLNDMICFGTIKALKEYPQVNAHFMGDSMKYFSGVHLAVAVDTDRGLMVPVVRNADALSITELSANIKELVSACRKGSIDPDLLSAEAASFTVSNLGSYGVEIFTPVINLPQVAILGVNTIVLRPKDLGEGIIGFVPYLGLSLTYDHRAIDGGEATRFLKRIATEIENLEF
ncbi:MAG TPA: dihydrolipoamide acetyltransferase family protein [Bacteroidales bacterium]|nr:dihydrolipoamide acetyltransferase family protein [Bacteroidales bacterium]